MTVRFSGAERVTLAADVYGPWKGPAVVLLHGGGQTRHAWGATAQTLADEGYFSVALDLRGHGESDWAPDGDYGIGAYAADLRAVVASLERPCALVGASLGGLTSLLAVGEEPAVDCTAVVLVDVVPRMEVDGRNRIGEFMRGRPEGFASVEEAADAVSAFLPHRPRPADVSGLRKNLRLDGDGRYHWHWDPAFMSGRLQDTVAVPERFERAAEAIRSPMLLVRGGSSEVVSEQGAAAWQRLVPGAELVDVAGAGHMVAGDRNDVFMANVVEFLLRTTPSGRNNP